MNKNMTLKEYLLSQGINAKQENLERNIKINKDSFKLIIEKELEAQLLELTVKEVFSLAYKSLLFLKSTDTFSILYLPKNIILKGICEKSSNDKFQITFNGYCNYHNENDLNKEKNIVLVDELDKNIEIEILK